MFMPSVRFGLLNIAILPLFWRIAQGQLARICGKTSYADAIGAALI
jgi:hypothetical protein